MRIAFEVYIDGVHYSTHYCNPEDIMENINEILSNPLAEIRETYLADGYGNRMRVYSKAETCRR